MLWNAEDVLCSPGKPQQWGGIYVKTHSIQGHVPQSGLRATTWMSEFPLLWALFYPHSRVILIPTLGGSHSQGQQGSVHHITLHVSETAAWRLTSDRRRISTHRHSTVFKFHDSFFFLTPAMPHARLARFKFSHPAQDPGPQQCKCPVVTTRPPENSLNSMILKLELIFCLFFFNSEPSSMRDLSSPTGIELVPPALGARSLNHWTAREFPGI